MTAILLGISLTTAVILSDAPKPDAAGQATKASRVVAAPTTPSVQEMLATTDESDALAGIRIVDPSWDKKISCSEGTWPYIEQRCLETKSATKAENKIGPGMIGPRIRPTAPETSGPIGSTTAIVPAAPKVTTDGVATHEADIEKHEEKHEDIAPPEPVLRAAPSKLVETRTSTVPAQTTTPRYTRSSQRRRPVRTFRLSEDTNPVVKPVATPRRAASVKRKPQRYVADAGRRRVRERVVRQAQAPQAPQFFFPFGWFVQAR